jgi:Flp pilus assembly protein TadD
VLIASRHRTRGDLSQAEAWYRRVLTLSPLHPQATSGLAAVLSTGGDHAAAERLCRQLEQRVGAGEGCDEH